MHINEFIDNLKYQVSEMRYQYFIKNWKEIFKNGSDIAIQDFLSNDKTKHNVKQLKHKHPNQFSFIHQELAKAIKDNNLDLTQQLINVGLDVNSPTIFTHFLDNVRLFKKEKTLPMLDILLEGGLIIYNENYQRYQTSPIHNVLETIELFKYHSNNKKVEYLNEESDSAYFNENTLYCILKKFTSKMSKINQNENENLVYLALNTKSQTIIKEVMSLPCITYEYIQKGLDKIDDKISHYAIVDEILAFSEKKLLEKNININDEKKSKKLSKI
jgi:hypothetical protein